MSELWYHVTEYNFSDISKNEVIWFNKKKKVSYSGLIWIVSLKASWRYLLILVCIAFPKFLNVFFWLMLHCNTELNWTWIHCQVGQEKGPCLWKILQGIIIPVFFLGALSALEQHHLVVIISVWTKCSSFRTSSYKHCDSIVMHYLCPNSVISMPEHFHYSNSCRVHGISQCAIGAFCGY